MSIATRGTIVYTPNVQDVVRIYLELFEVVFCFMIAIVKELFTLTAQVVRFCQAWKDWRWQCFIGNLDLGFDLQQDWDDLEAVWLLINYKETVYGVYWCRQNGWVKVDW